MHVFRIALLITTVFLMPCAAIFAQPSLQEIQEQLEGPPSDRDLNPEPERELRKAMVRLPVAAGLAAALAFRPKRRGTPARKPPVIQTQIILAIVGAVVMLVVGVSLARAFGIVGASALVRYRAKIDDPKDAGVMLSTLTIGLAAGVGLYLLAVFTTAFVMACLWVIETLEPEARKDFNLKITTKNPEKLRPQVETLLRRSGVVYDLRTASADELTYHAALPYARRTERLSTSITRLDPEKQTAVEWEEKKSK